MRKVIAAMNMTLDGFCNHEYGIADEELHNHYTNLLSSADTILYGKTTYLLMEDYWPALVEKPSGVKSNDDFALAIDKIDKLVFTRTLHELRWKTARIASRTVEEEIRKLKEEPGRDILVGSPSLIVSCLNHGLLNELQIVIHPVVVGNGLPLFNPMKKVENLQLFKSKQFETGAILLHYTLTTP